MNKQKKVWSQEEDAIIKELYQDKGIDNWNEISRIMSDQYNLSKKSAKQCKQRYEAQTLRYLNHINSSIIRVQWTTEEENLFIELHNKIGNKWASIAQYLEGKSDNCVKNHFYSKLRKLLRKLNKIIYFYCKKQFRPIDIAIMYKIVEAAEQRFKQRPGCQQKISLQCLRVQNKMLEFAMFQEDEQDTPYQIQKYKELIKQIYTVSKMYKRKSKKVRNSLIQAPTIKKAKHQQQEQYLDSNRVRNIVVQQSDNQNHSEDQVKEEYEDEKGVGIQLYNFQFKPSNLQNQHSSKQKSERLQENNKIQIEQGDGIHQLLRNTGILHDQYNNMVFFGQRTPSVNFPLSQRSSFKSYSQIDPAQNPFFDDSNNLYGGLNFPMNFKYPPK